VSRLIVDGYNLLHAHPAYASLIQSDIDTARARLVADLAGLAQGGRRIVVVFDGGGNPRSDGTPHHVGKLAVIFSPAGTTADTVIERLAARARSRGEHAIVVTSDTATRQAVRSGSVSVLTSEHFIEDLTVDATDRRDASRTGVRRVALAGRIDPAARDSLARWARGQGPGAR
jgi:hypothetical protein